MWSFRGMPYFLGSRKISKARKESNKWIRTHACSISGNVISIGSGTDEDGERGHYRDYFKNCSSYTTSDSNRIFRCDCLLDVRSMSGVQDGSFDCVFCSGVLEHVDDFIKGLGEITRILRPGGVLLLGLPFRQALHLAPNDYWRFTEHGIRHLMEKCGYIITDLKAMDCSVKNFPAAYWVRAEKRTPRES